jgi:hypothetical protein
MAKIKRSNLSVAERCMNDVSGSLEKEEAEKDVIMQKLNDALMQLDDANYNKRLLSDKLVE